MDDNMNSATGFIDDNTLVFKERKRWLFLGLPWTFTVYRITPGVITVKRGLLSTMEDDCYMYKIQDVKWSATLLEKLIGCGTITCFTGDVTNPELKLVHIRHAKEIKSYILKTSEESRLRRRTINMQDIGVNGSDADGDGILD